MKKGAVRDFLSRLLLPLYVIFFFSLGSASLLSGFFEHYVNMPFQDIAELVRENNDSIRFLFESEHEEEGEEPSAEVLEAELKIEQSFTRRFGSEEIFSLEEKLMQKYPLYSLSDPGGLMLLALIIWLWPVYRHLFRKRDGQADPRTQFRVMNLSFVLIIMPWAAGLISLVVKIVYRQIDGIELAWHDKANFMVSYLMYASVAAYVNSWFTTRYVNNGIARKVFKGDQLHALKKGISLNLTTRVLLLVISVGMIPLILNIYVPAVFNSWMFRSIMHEGDVDLVALGQIFGPLLITAVLNFFFILFQIFSIVTFRKNIQGPLNILIERMQLVAKGDFSTRTTVLSSDELGNLKGHFNTMVEGLEEREKLRDTFGKFVSIEIAKKLTETGEIDLEGEEIETTVMFADIRSFTSLSEGYTPRELIEFLNDYFSYLVRPIVEEQGVVNKFIGDCIMAVFSPVFGLEDHAEAAVRASLGMRRALEEFNVRGKYPTIRQGIGIHTGLLIAGNVGSENRKEYTVIGDTVNVASRIESQTKVYGTDILISESTQNLLSPEAMNSLHLKKNEPVIVRGKSRPITLYSLD